MRLTDHDILTFVSLFSWHDALTGLDLFSFFYNLQIFRSAVLHWPNSEFHEYSARNLPLQLKELFEIRIRNAKVKKTDKETWDTKYKNKIVFQSNT